MKKKGNIVKIARGEMVDLAKKDITYSGKNIILSAGASINETGESGVSYEN